MRFRADRQPSDHLLKLHLLLAQTGSMRFTPLGLKHMILISVMFIDV
jgi:hypothetical protein